MALTKRFQIRRNDSIPAFGGWCAGSFKEDEPIILLNVLACFDEWTDEDGEIVEATLVDRKELIITTLMHEVGHALEEFFKLEFSEELMHSIVESFQAQMHAADDAGGA